MREALDWIEEFLANPAVGLLEPTEQSLRQTLRWMRQFDLGRKRILDTHLAAVLHTAGAHPMSWAVRSVWPRNRLSNGLGTHSSTSITGEPARW